jgi:hypothetical protein
MLEDRKIRIDQERKEELDDNTRKTERELVCEMDLYEWRLIYLQMVR